MKTKIGFLIGVTLALLIGFGAGVYTGTHESSVTPSVQVGPAVTAHEQPLAAAKAELADQLTAAQKELNELRTKYTENNPAVQRAIQRVESFKQQLAPNSH